MNKKTAIKFGPFSAPYHQKLVNDRFKQNLSRFIDDVLLPQLDEDVNSIQGSVTAEFNQQRYCGPNSAVKDVFKIDLALTSQSGVSHYKARLKYDDPTFSTRRGSTFYLWTPARQKTREKQIETIQEIAQNIIEKIEVKENCPVCNTAIQFTNTEYLLAIGCSNQCFSYHYHKDPETENVLHGHFFITEPDWAG